MVHRCFNNLMFKKQSYFENYLLIPERKSHGKNIDLQIAGYQSVQLNICMIPNYVPYVISTLLVIGDEYHYVDLSIFSTESRTLHKSSLL